MKIKMVAYNDGRAIFIHNRKTIFPFFLASFILSLLSLIPTFIFSIYELLFIFLLPSLFLLFIAIDYLLIPYNTHNFLKKTKKKHIFSLEDGILFKDGKMVKQVEYIRLYSYRHYLFLELKNSFYYINDDDYIEGSRLEFLKLVKYREHHYIYFDLPPKSKEEILEMYFNDLSLENVRRLFYSPSKEKIVYIYKDEIGSYSVAFMQFIMADEIERLTLHTYGWWEPDFAMANQSYYETEESAYHDIKNIIQNYIELKGLEQNDENI